MNYIKAFTTYINGIFKAKRNKYRFKTISFTKENGTWYVDYPNWKGSKANLSMVAGADTMLDALTKKNHISLRVIDSRCHLPGYEKDGLIELERVYKSLFGSYYKCTDNILGFNDKNEDTTLYLCPVTLSVLGYYPRYIYFRVN
jgi:hypothetical protein